VRVAGSLCKWTVGDGVDDAWNWVWMVDG
jgi:hypothetical protein